MKNRYTLLFLILLLVLFGAKLFYIGWGPLDLVPDEAHYWDWSRHPDICYYSKGPVVAYNILLAVKIGEFLGIKPPNPAFWVRLPAVVNSVLLGIVAWFFSNMMWRDKKISFYTILILAAVPIYAIGSIIMTIDNPLMLFWALYIFLVFLSVSKREGIYWYLSGIAFGLGFLSKYTMIILIPCTIVYLLTTQEHRFWLKRKEFYIGLLIGILFTLPVLIWNIRHDWIGLRHLAGQAGLSGGGLKQKFFQLHIFEFVGIQFGVVSPVIFILIVMGFFYAWRYRRDYQYNFLFWMGVPLGIFYLLLSLHEYCQANWLAPVYYTGAVLTSVFFRDSRILKIGIIVGFIMWLLVFLVDLFPFIPNKFNPTIRARGWKKLGNEIGEIQDRLKKDGRCFIFSDTYQVTSELAFYIPGQPHTYCINLGRRMNQYDLWESFFGLIGFNAIYVKHRDQDMDKEITGSFSSWKKVPLIEIKKGGRVLHQYSVFLCYNFRGMKKGKYEITY